MQQHPLRHYFKPGCLYQYIGCGIPLYKKGCSATRSGILKKDDIVLVTSVYVASAGKNQVRLRVGVLYRDRQYVMTVWYWANMDAYTHDFFDEDVPAFKLMIS